jgi:hypothetical protein
VDKQTAHDSKYFGTLLSHPDNMQTTSWIVEEPDKSRTIRVHLTPEARAFFAFAIAE